MKTAGLALFLTLALSMVVDAQAQDSTITYQGQLRQSGEPFTGMANLEFQLFDQFSGGSQVGASQTRLNWPIEDGLFQVELDFGLSAFTAQVRYLEVRVNGAPLNPRQAVRPSPMALFALAGNEGPAGPAGPQGAIGPQGSAGPQGPEGPPGASPFTLDPDSGDIEYVHNGQVMRFEPVGVPSQAPIITFGHGSNVNPNPGGVISGGGTSTSPNEITAGTYGVISGGRGNTVTQSGGTISGGINNSVGQEAALGGGTSNTANGFQSTVGGGLSNVATGSRSTISGGETNQASGSLASVGGGRDNVALALFSAVGGGVSNAATSEGSVVSGGVNNSAQGFYSTVSGGRANCAGSLRSWAGGSNAKVRPGSNAGALVSGCEGVPLAGIGGDEGTFVWADRQLPDFISGGSNQFLVRALGGAVFTGGAVNTAAGNRLRVDGTLRVDTLGSAGATTLCRNADNQIATCSSSARYKQEIEDLGSAAALIDALRPVHYRWIDSGIEDIGFVAEEVAELMPELITRNDNGEVEGVKYDRITAVLVRAMQEQQAENAKLHAEIARLADQQVRLDRLTERSAELETRLAAMESLLFEGRRQAEAR